MCCFNFQTREIVALYQCVSSIGLFLSESFKSISVFFHIYFSVFFIFCTRKHEHTKVGVSEEHFQHPLNNIFQLSFLEF